MPNAPSPRDTTTCRSGMSSAAATPYGMPTPRQPKAPAVEIGPAHRSPRRAKLRMSPPSAIVIASGFSTSRKAAKMRFGCMCPSFPARRASRARRRTSTSGARARRAAPWSSRIECRSRAWRSHRPAPTAQAPGCANSSTSPRRFSRSSSPLSAMRIQRAFGKHRRRAVAQLVVELAADDDDEVRLLHRPRAHRADDRGMLRRERGRGFPACRDRARRCASRNRTSSRRVAHRAATGDHAAGASLPRSSRRARDVGRVGRNAARRLGREELVEHDARRHASRAARRSGIST